MEEAGGNTLVEHERRAATPVVREVARRQLFKEREIDRETQEQGSRDEPEKGREAEFSEVGSSEKEKGKRREPGISRAEVDYVGRQIEGLGKQINELKRRGRDCSTKQEFAIFEQNSDEGGRSKFQDARPTQIRWDEGSARAYRRIRIGNEFIWPIQSH
ncbi:UNVERIFIED_CONTAM: hypothetical protein Sradi_5066800 [Sesamum radiatum]|uniref:Uncharacterized protein n=1 Tax=Sesamum radiatum TaxID=300843 RepID=A0AAW2M0H6_SESRA